MMSEWKSLTGSKKTVSPKPGRITGQYFLDLGQSDFSYSTCSVCGLLYARGHENDEKVHKVFHRNRTRGIQFKGWKSERVISREEGTETRVVLVLPEDALHQAKVKEVVDVMEVELGLSPGWLLQRPCKVYLFISSSKKIVGCAMAEPIRHAFRVMPVKQQKHKEDQCDGEGIRLSTAFRECPHGSVQVDKRVSGPPIAAEIAIEQITGATSSIDIVAMGMKGEDDRHQSATIRLANTERLVNCGDSHVIRPNHVQIKEENRSIPSCTSNTVVKNQSNVGGKCGRMIVQREDSPGLGSQAANVMLFGNVKFIREVAPRKKLRQERTQELGSAIMCSKTPVPAICGVRVIWVSHSERRKGIASQLIDAMRRTFCLGIVLEPSQIAFSQPTPDGKGFAAQYCQTDEFLIYTK